MQLPVVNLTSCPPPPTARPCRRLLLGPLASLLLPLVLLTRATVAVSTCNVASASMLRRGWGQSVIQQHLCQTATRRKPRWGGGGRDQQHQQLASKKPPHIRVPHIRAPHITEMLPSQTIQFSSSMMWPKATYWIGKPISCTFHIPKP